TEQEQRGDDEPADGGKAFVLALGGGESEDRRAERKPIEDDDRDHEQRHQRVHRAEENHDKEKRESGRRQPDHEPANFATEHVPDGERGGQHAVVGPQPLDLGIAGYVGSTDAARKAVGAQRPGGRDVRLGPTPAAGHRPRSGKTSTRSAMPSSLPSSDGAASIGKRSSSTSRVEYWSIKLRGDPDATIFALSITTNRSHSCSASSM